MWTAWDISLNRAKQPQFYFDIWYSGNAGPAFQPATRVELFKLDRAIAMLKERKDAVYLGERKMYGPRNYAKSYDFNSWKLGDCAVCLETLKSNIGSCERMLMPENLIKIFGKDPVNILEIGTILGLNPEERKLELEKALTNMVDLINEGTKGPTLTSDMVRNMCQFVKLILDDIAKAKKALSAA